MPSCNIAVPVANHPGTRGINIIFDDSLFEQTRLGLPAEASILGRVGACVYRIDVSATSLEFFLHFGVDGVQGSECQPPMPDSGLICDDNEQIAGFS